jgi:hypothetical protein
VIAVLAAVSWFLLPLSLSISLIHRYIHTSFSFSLVVVVAQGYKWLDYLVLYYEKDWPTWE